MSYWVLQWVAGGARSRLYHAWHGDCTISDDEEQAIHRFNFWYRFGLWEVP